MKTLILSAIFLINSINPKVKYEDKKIQILSECQYQMILTDDKGRTLINDSQECGYVSIDLALSPKGTIYTLTIITQDGEEIKKEIKIE